MVNVTFAIPEDLKAKMDSHAEINWSAVAREAFAEKVNDLEFLKKFKSKSRLTEREAAALGGELSKKLAKRR